jgi:cell wall-associated NlpC family hydrolase
VVRTNILVLLAALATGCASSGAVPRPFPGAALPPTDDPTVVVEAPAPGRPPVEGERGPGDEPPAGISSPSPAATLVALALTFRGTPYRNGGSDPSGFDCSGFVQWVFARQGLRLPREVRDQYGVGGKVDRDEVQPGDLVFFETVARGASHVGIAIGNDQFVHAPSSRGVVRVESYTSSYWSPRWIGARRVM